MSLRLTLLRSERLSHGPTAPVLSQDGKE
jgi:hypothetical protein